MALRAATLLGWSVIMLSLPLAADPVDDPVSDAPLHFGIQATLADPAQDLRGLVGKRGTGGGIFFEQDLDEQLRVRVRFDYVSYGQGTLGPRDGLPSFVPPTATAMEADQASLGFEVRYAPPALRGAFLLGGVSGARAEFGSLSPSTDGSGQVRTKEKTSVKPCFSLGLGFRITSSLSVSARYTTSRSERHHPLGGGGRAGLQVLEPEHDPKPAPLRSRPMSRSLERVFSGTFQLSSS